MVSIIILTFNEENDLSGCLSSISWCDDIHILDSGSTDNTVQIARSYGANVKTNPFKSFGTQRNFALDNIPVKYEWVLFLDADEHSTPEFKTKMLEVIENSEPFVVGYYCCWKMMLEDRWLKHSDNYPKWQFRLLKKGKARFTDFGHGQKESEIRGNLAYLNEPYLHYGFSKGWTLWIQRHNRYSTEEAYARLNSRPPLRNIFSSHGSVRNPALKSWLSAMPGWPLFRFIYSYLLKFGFLEGMPGFIYCVNMGYYEFLIKIKIREIKRHRSSCNTNSS